MIPFLFSRHLRHNSLSRSVSRCFSSTSTSLFGMELKQVISRLESWAPPHLAESWDNVGLLIEPSQEPKRVSKILLTNDLTSEVMAESLEEKVDLIISYHPPIFTGLKRITRRSWKERHAAICLENKIAVYSPHTVFDNIAGGVADWLIKPFGSGKVNVVTQKSEHKNHMTHNVLVSGIGVLTECDSANGLQTILALSGVNVKFQDSDESISIDCNKSKLAEVLQALAKLNKPEMDFRILKLEPHPVEGQGSGRRKILDKDLRLREVVDIAKKHCGIQHLRLATAVGISEDSLVKTIAVCPGSGHSILASCHESVDVFVTGEMSHHEVLDATHNGTSVILCEHSNSERGFLSELKTKLLDLLENPSGLEIKLSQSDKDPLKVV